MTTRDDSSGGTVDRLLLDAGHADVPELRAALLSIAVLAQMQVPAPGPELAAMLAGSRDELTKKRWLRQYRPAIVGLAVLAGMGLGVSGVAATSQVSEGGSGRWSIQDLTTDWTPDWTLPLAPAGSDQDGRPAWVSPLFLQLDEALSSAEDQDAGPDTLPAGPGNANGQASTTAPDAQVLPPAKGHDGAPGAASGNGKTGRPDAETSGAGRSESAPEELSGTDSADQPGESSDQATPSPEENSAEDRGQKSRKNDESGTGLLDSTVDSVVEPVNSWLRKFRP
jgi:hypothetical protein